MTYRCDSFGNRPVNVTNNYHRKNSFGSGRVRSGSTGNRPVKVNNNFRSIRQPTANTAQFNDTNKPHHTNRSSQFVIRQPPHQQQSQQHNFAAPRKGIFNHSNNVTASVQSTKEFNAKLSQNSKDHNKENLTGKNDGKDGKLNATIGASSSVSSGSPVNTATVGSAGAKQ